MVRSLILWEKYHSLTPLSTSFEILYDMALLGHALYSAYRAIFSVFMALLLLPIWICHLIVFQFPRRLKTFILEGRSLGYRMFKGEVRLCILKGSSLSSESKQSKGIRKSLKLTIPHYPVPLQAYINSKDTLRLDKLPERVWDQPSYLERHSLTCEAKSNANPQVVLYSELQAYSFDELSSTRQALMM